MNSQKKKGYQPAKADNPCKQFANDGARNLQLINRENNSNTRRILEDISRTVVHGRSTFKKVCKVFRIELEACTRDLA